MPKGHRIDPATIPPFPTGIDRDGFGHWLSGFVDGEGTFALKITKVKKGRFPLPGAEFAITLRADDADALQLMQSFWRCGQLTEWQFYQYGDLNCKPSCTYRIANATDLATILVPHFDRYPLRAKKRHDYAIWRQGVMLCYSVKQRRRVGRPGGNGIHYKWTEAEKDEFVGYRQALITQRKYQMPPPKQEQRPPREERTLFDDPNG